jgi:hypothetical protein
MKKKAREKINKENKKELRLKRQNNPKISLLIRINKAFLIRIKQKLRPLTMQNLRKRDWS